MLGVLVGSYANQLLSAKVLFYIGTLSYSLYLVHFALIQFTANMVSAIFAGHNFDIFTLPLVGITVFFVSLTVVSIFVALILFYSVERPFLILRKRILSR